MNAQPLTEEASNGSSLVPTSRVPVPMGPRGILIAGLDELWRFAQCVARSGMAPKGMQSPQSVAVAIQMGLEVGLSPMSALQNIAVINGRPGLFGDAALALVRTSGLCLEVEEWFEQGGQRLESQPTRWSDDATAVCCSRRQGQQRPKTTRFSVADAKLAKLWGKVGRDGQDTPWITYPGRMLMFRARGFNLRDNFGDVLKGFKTVEGLRDYPDDLAAGTSTPKSARRQQPTPAPEPASQPEPPEQQQPEPAASAATPPDPVEECGLDQDELAELAMADFIGDMDDAIKAATTVPEIEEVRHKLDTHRKWLGEDQYQTLLFRQQARRRELTSNVSRK